MQGPATMRRPGVRTFVRRGLILASGAVLPVATRGNKPVSGYGRLFGRVPAIRCGALLLVMAGTSPATTVERLCTIGWTVQRKPARKSSSILWGVGANGLTTVTPPQVKPSCMSSDRSARQPASEAAARMTASQVAR